MQNTYPGQITIRFASIIVNTLTSINKWFTKNISVSWLLILVYAYTAFSKAQLFNNGKIIDVKQFQDDMFKSPLLQNHIGVLGYLIPAAEIGICLLLLLKSTKLVGYYASLLLMCVFTTYIIYMFIWAPALPCACAGIISAMNWHQHLALNVFLILVNVRAIVLTHKQNKSTKQP